MSRRSGRSRKLMVAGLAVAFVLASACSGDKSGTASQRTVATAPEGGYRLELSPTATDAGVRAVGTTNLPNGTDVLVHATRSFLATGETEVQGAPLGAAPGRVANGAFSAEVRFDIARMAIGIVRQAKVS